VDGEEKTMELNRPENMAKEEMSKIKRHKTAYAKSILVPMHEIEDSVLWKYTVYRSRGYIVGKRKAVAGKFALSPSTSCCKENTCR
jgi:hypothetical protein